MRHFHWQGEGGRVKSEKNLQQIKKQQKQKKAKASNKKKVHKKRDAKRDATEIAPQLLKTGMTSETKFEIQKN